MADTDKLQTIKEIIENMSKCYQIEILKILNNEESVVVSENNNGTFINLTNLDANIITKLENYIDYVNKQQYQLLHVEKEKDIIKSEFFKQERNIKKSRKFNDVVETPKQAPSYGI